MSVSFLLFGLLRELVIIGGLRKPERKNIISKLLMHMQKYITNYRVFAFIAGIVVVAAMLFATFAYANAASVNANVNAAVSGGMGGLLGGNPLFGGNGNQTLGESISCAVFGILNNAGVVGHTPDRCDGDGQPPPPPPPPHGHDGRLTVIKQVNGGSAAPSAFTLHVNTNTSADAFPGSANGTVVDVDANTAYAVTEDSYANYTASFSGQCSGTMPPNGNRVCIVTNTYSTTTPPAATSTLRVVKTVSGGTASSSDFQIHVKKNGTDVSGSPQAGTTTGSTYMNLANGTYVVSESGGPNGYTASFSGACDANGSVTFNSATSATCTVTNTYNAATSSLRVIKVVNGGTASSSAFQIHVKSGGNEISGSPQAGTTTGTTYSGLLFGNYTVSETGGPSGYSATFSGDCNSSGVVNVNSTSQRTCTITNTFATSTATTTGMLRVIKNVWGNTASSSAFQIHVKMASTSAEVAGSPQAGSATGTTYTLEPGIYMVSETGGPNGYWNAFSGDCFQGGAVTVTANTLKTCTITNTRWWWLI